MGFSAADLSERASNEPRIARRRPEEEGADTLHRPRATTKSAGSRCSRRSAGGDAEHAFPFRQLRRRRRQPGEHRSERKRAINTARSARAERAIKHSAPDGVLFHDIADSCRKTYRTQPGLSLGRVEGPLGDQVSAGRPDRAAGSGVTPRTPAPTSICVPANQRPQSFDSWLSPARGTKINSFDPSLTAVCTACATPPFLPFAAEIHI